MIATIPDNKLIELHELNKEKGISIRSLAKKHKIPYATLYRKLKWLEKQGKHIRLEYKAFNKMMEEEESKMTTIQQDNAENLIRIKTRFKDSMKVNVKYSLKARQMHFINGDVIIEKVYDDFLLIVKQGVDVIVKECISFRDIFTEYVRVKVIS